jgi:hypothetical protein
MADDGKGPAAVDLLLIVLFHYMTPCMALGRKKGEESVFAFSKLEDIFCCLSKNILVNALILLVRAYK